METINQLFDIIKNRQNKLPKNSYTAKLFKEGVEKISQKVGEEGVETAIAGVKKNKEELTYEMADLWYHCLVLLAAFDLSPKDIEQELKKRFK